MQRIALGLAVWSLLLLVIAGLAALAQPESGPPMPRGASPRATVDALVPEEEVRPTQAPRDVAPDAMSGTVAPRVSLEPSTPEARPADGSEPKAATTAEPDRPEPKDVVIPGLGSLPAGVPAEEEGFGLHIVRSDGRPATGATVRWLLRRDLDAARAAGRDPATMLPFDLLADSTRTTLADANGFAMLTSEAGPMVIDARLGDEYGSVEVRREEVSHRRIVLARDTTLSVRVEDAAGTARAGVPVVLRGQDGRTIWTARTAADGRGALRFADGVVLAARARFEDLTVAVDIPGGAFVVLPSATIPIDEVRLVAERGSRLLVWVRDADGQPCKQETVVRVAPIRGEIDARDERRRTVTDGLAVFEDVPAGLELEVSADTRCSPVALQSTVRTTSADEVTVELTTRSPMPRARGRLVDPRGNPWREFEVVAWILEAGVWSAQGSARTDDRGSFVVDIPGAHAAPRAIDFVLVGRNPYGRTVVSSKLAFEPFGASASTPAVRDLGDVQAPDWTTLVRGVVLDENERPIDGAGVELCDALGVPDPRTRVTADERGGFSLRGPPPEGDALIVHAIEPERRAADATVTLRRGDPRARVVIAVHGSLSGKVLLPLGAPEGSVIVRIERSNGAALALTADDAGAFTFSNVDAGEVRLVFHPVGFEEPLLVLERVLVPRGGPSLDPRLAHVDLTDRAAVVELEIVDERGSPMPSASIGPLTQDTGRPHGRPRDVTDGVVRVLVQRGVQALMVAGEGYEPAVVMKPSGRVRVELKPSGG